MRSQKQIDNQIKRMRLQIQAIEAGISVLKGEKQFEDFDGEDCGPLVAEYASEWLEQEHDYNIVDIPISIINDEVLKEELQN